MRARPEASQGENLTETRPPPSPRPSKVLKCFRCRLAHKACVWAKYGISRAGSRLPAKCCIPCSKSKERIDSCVPIAFEDLTKEQRRILKEADKQRAIKLANQESARRQRSKSSSESGREDNARRRRRRHRPPSPNHYVPQRYLAETAHTIQHRALIDQTQATGYSRSAELLTSKQSNNAASPQYVAPEQMEAQGFFGNPIVKMSSSSFFSNPALNSPSHELSYLQRQLSIPLEASLPTNHSFEPAEWYAPEDHIKPINTPRPFQNSLHGITPMPSSTSSYNLLMNDKEVTNAGITPAEYSIPNVCRNPSLKINKGRSSVALKSNSAEDLDDAEGESQSDGCSMSSSTSIDDDLDSDVSSESYPWQYPSDSLYGDKKYQQKKDGRDYEWAECRQLLKLAWSDVYSQYHRFCAFRDKGQENRKAKKKAAKHHKALEEALRLVKSLLEKIHKLARLADRAGDYGQRVLFRKDILVQLTEHNLWFQDLKLRVSSELLQAESGGHSLIRRTSRRREILSPLRSAVLAKDIEAIRACVVEEGGLNEVGPDGKTALVLAVEIEAIDIVILLVEELHADVDGPKRGLGPTPLHMAILRMNNDIVDLLLKNGAKVNINAPLEKGGQSIMAVDLAAYLADPNIFGDDRIQKSIEKKRPNLDPWILGRLYEPQRGLIPPNFREHIANYVKRTAQTPELETADTSLVSMLTENSEGTSFEDIFGFAGSENLVEFSGHSTNV